MKYLKLFEGFGDELDDLKDIFSFAISNVEIKRISYSYSKSSKYFYGDLNINEEGDFFIYIVYGKSKNILNDNEFLKELYGYGDILVKVYNKEFFYINLKKYPIIILYDKFNKHNHENYLNNIKYKYVKNIKKIIPNYIFNLFPSEITKSIDYSDGSSSNLSLFPWIYE